MTEFKSQYIRHYIFQHENSKYLKIFLLFKYFKSLKVLRNNCFSWYSFQLDTFLKSKIKKMTLKNLSFSLSANPGLTWSQNFLFFSDMGETLRQIFYHSNSYESFFCLSQYERLNHGEPLWFIINPYSFAISPNPWWNKTSRAVKWNFKRAVYGKILSWI